MTSHLQSSPQPISLLFSSYFFFIYFLQSFFFSFFIELENLFNAINAPDDGGEEKVEETRSLKPVRIPINLLTLVSLFLKGLERFPGCVFIYLCFEGKMTGYKFFSLYLNASFHKTELPTPTPFPLSFFNSRLDFSNGLQEL